MTTPQTGDTPKFPVQIWLKDGRSVTVNVMNPYEFIQQLADQLSRAETTSTYWFHQTAPFLLLVREIVMAVPVAQE